MEWNGIGGGGGEGRATRSALPQSAMRHARSRRAMPLPLAHTVWATMGRQGACACACRVQGGDASCIACSAWGCTQVAWCPPFVDCSRATFYALACMHAQPTKRASPHAPDWSPVFWFHQ